MCAEAGVPLRVGEFARRNSPTVQALLCTAEDGSWDAAVTVVRASWIPDEQHWDGGKFSRHPHRGYDLDTPGEIVYELQISENDDGASGHGPRPLVLFRLVADAQATADELILWTRRADLFRVAVPAPDQSRQTRQARRCFEHRQAAAAAPQVHTAEPLDDTPADPATADLIAADLAALDHSALCWHFPRDRTGRYQRSAVVALAAYGGRRPHLRDRWLTVRADGERLVVSVQDLIGANQRHRWDGTRWLWDRRHAAATRATRWQVGRPAQAAPGFDALRRGALAEAFALAGVQVDDHIAKLLDGRPNLLSRCELTATWVAALYDGLAEVAPWRLAQAGRSWQEGRAALGLPARGSIVLFGLGGMGRLRKPKIALELRGDTAVLRLVFSGSNAVLPRSLWTVPADLAGHLHGWQPTGNRPGRAAAARVPAR